MSVSQSEFDKIMEGLAMKKPEEKIESGVLWFCRNCGIEPTEDNVKFIKELFESETGCRVCRHFTEARSLPGIICDYIVNDIYNRDFTKKATAGFFERSSNTFKAITEFDNTIKGYLDNLPLTEIFRAIEFNVKTWGDFVLHKELIGSKAVEIASFHEIEERDLICENPILSCDNLQYVGVSKKNFQSIICEVICASTLKKDELKKHLSKVRKIVMEKLEKEKVFKDNPELLKHIKISNMYYNGCGIIRVHLEWKESFAYDHLK